MARIALFYLTICLACFTVFASNFAHASSWGNSVNLNEMFREAVNAEEFDLSTTHVVDDFRILKLLKPLQSDPNDVLSVLVGFGCETQYLENKDQDLDLEYKLQAPCSIDTTNLVELHAKIWEVYVQNGRPKNDYCRSLHSFHKSLTETYQRHRSRLQFAYARPATEDGDEREAFAISNAEDKATQISQTISHIPLYESYYLTTFLKAYAAMAILSDRVETSCNGMINFDQYTPFSAEGLREFINSTIEAGVRSFDVSNQQVELSLSNVKLDWLKFDKCNIESLMISDSNMAELTIENSLVVNFNGATDGITLRSNVIRQFTLIDTSFVSIIGGAKSFSASDLAPNFYPVLSSL